MEAATRDFHLLGSTGAVRAGYHVHDWSVSPLGPPERWSPALRNAVSLILEPFDFQRLLFAGAKQPLFDGAEGHSLPQTILG